MNWLKHHSRMIGTLMAVAWTGISGYGLMWSIYTGKDVHVLVYGGLTLLWIMLILFIFGVIQKAVDWLDKL